MTANWMDGYVADVAYTLGYYRELAPSFLHFACLANGISAPRPEQNLRYCELGCGRGYGTLLLAAANPNSHFVGIDFNPAHIAEARRLAERAKIANIAFLEMSFGDAAKSARPELAEFDIVALHGVYTWVMPEVRRQILDFVREKLVSGGLVYVSYNCMPGWAPAGPMQRLFKEVDDRSTRQSIAVIDEGMELLKKLVQHSSAFIAHNPAIKTRIEKMGGQDKAYLAHEFLNAGWQPIYVTDAMTEFASAKTTYAGSASIMENRNDLCVPRDLVPLVQGAPDTALRELLKDYAINKQFRRDIYVKGPQQLSAREQRRLLGETIFAPAQMSDAVPEKLPLPIGELKPKPEIMTALMNGVGKAPSKGAAIISAGIKAGLKEPDALLYLLLLVNAGILLPARPDYASVDRAPAQRLNRTIMELNAAADSHRYLASPVLGSAVNMPFVDRIFAPLIETAPKKGDGEIAAAAFDQLAKSGQSFRRKGEPIAKNEKNIAEIGAVVKEFREQRLPRWRALGIIS